MAGLERRGRRSRRTLKIITVPNWIGIAGASQVAQLRRTVSRKNTGKRTTEIVYLVTSATDVDPDTLAS